MEKQRRIMEDAILSGLLQAHGCQVLPEVSERGRTQFVISGDVDDALSRIYADDPIGSLTVMMAIKACRHMIFNTRGDDDGKKYSR